MSKDTVGSLLADIANSITDSLRILDGSDKSQWGPDEHEQLRRLEHALDEARKDFQELSPFLDGQHYYMNDRRPQSIEELRLLRTKFQHHAESFRQWAHQGGPINALWAAETTTLRHELHRAQCRAARRIFASKQVQASPRCLGAFLVYRKQREWALKRAQRRRRQKEQQQQQQQQNASGGSTNHGQMSVQQPQLQQQQQQQQQQQHQQQQHQQAPATPTARELYRHRRKGSTLVPADDRAADSAADDEYEEHRFRMEELALCNSIGKFQRFGDRDISFICDFCDGHIIWEDLETMPSIRTVDEEAAATAAEAHPGAADGTAAPDNTAVPRAMRPLSPEAPGILHWQATGFTVSEHREKSVVFPPLAIANHVAPTRIDWVVQLRCPACDEPPADHTPPEGGEDDGAGVWQMDDELVFDDLPAFEEHLYWKHTPTYMPSMPVSLPLPSASCLLM
ncbi:hypothetical protein ACRALDRAFT_2039387 [Sodiomyces alcalophilus JCM 7366]|uniref:uncharacterized protein n=1 Tax=Sodiomyces alcalophilus JCM 7366 TaxID=591952 RepID=UPI0039B49BE2